MGSIIRDSNRVIVLSNRDVLKRFEGIIMPSISRTRSYTEPAKPYKELITSPVYFTNEKWQVVSGIAWHHH